MREMLETPVTVSYATSLAEVALNPADSPPADPLHKTHAFDDLDESVAPSARLRELVRQTNYQNMFHKILPGQRKGAGSAAAAAAADDDAKVKTHAYVCLEQQREASYYELRRPDGTKDVIDEAALAPIFQTPPPTPRKESPRTPAQPPTTPTESRVVEPEEPPSPDLAASWPSSPPPPPTLLEYDQDVTQVIEDGEEDTKVSRVTMTEDEQRPTCQDAGWMDWFTCGVVEACNAAPDDTVPDGPTFAGNNRPNANTAGRQRRVVSLSPQPTRDEYKSIPPSRLCERCFLDNCSCKLSNQDVLRA